MFQTLNMNKGLDLNPMRIQTRNPNQGLGPNLDQD